MKTIIRIIISAAAGALVSWAPYGYPVLPVFIVLTLIFVVRRTIDKNFRSSEKDGRQATFFIVFWIVIAVFYVKPSGLDTFIPKMNIEDREVGALLSDWGKKLPNIDFDCDSGIAHKRISIHTITPISISEALKLIEEKAEAKYTYSQDTRGRSIAGGPHIKIIIKPAGTDIKKFYRPESPYLRGIQ